MSWKCIDCEVDTFENNEYYMLYDSIWEAAGMIKYTPDMLCIGCVEKRIGRLLTAADFVDYPINTSSYFSRSDRLRDRLARI